MTSLTGRVARNVRTANSALPSAGLLLLAAGVIPFSGWLMARNSSGYGVPFTETTGLISAGRAQLDGAAGTADGDTSIIVDTMVEDIDQSATAGDYFVDADAPAVAYGVSNHEIGKLATGRSIAGVFFGINADTGKARLWSGPAAHAMALGMLAGGTATAEAPMLRARAATTATLVATLSGIVLTADANGALAAQDGVTLAVGDRVFAKDQTAGAARGLYVVTSLGGASSKAVFTRAPEFDATAEAFGGLSVFVSEGTIAGNTTWDLTTDDPIVLGTTSLTFTKRPTLAEFASTSNGKGASLVAVEDPGGLYAAAELEALVLELKVLAPVRQVRGVVASNIADLAVFTVAGNDGLTYTAGQRVLLAAQTTAAQCGIYVVGTVGGGTAALTRAADMPAGAAVVPGGIIEVSEGTVFAGSTWKAFATTGAIVGTNDPVYYPRNFSKVVTLSSGTYTIGAGGGSELLFLRSTTLSDVQITRDTPGGTIATTIEYAAPIASMVAGKAGTAAVLVRSAIADGSILNTDNSTLRVKITNW